MPLDPHDLPIEQKINAGMESALSNDVTPSRESPKPKILNESTGKMNSRAVHLPCGPSTALVR